MRLSRDKSENCGSPSINDVRSKRVSFLIEKKTNNNSSLWEQIDYSSCEQGNLFGSCSISRRSSDDDLRIKYFPCSPRSPSRKGHARDDSYARYPVTEITPTIYLGNDQDACDNTILMGKKITHILSLVGRKHRVTNDTIKIKRMCVPMNDAGNTEVTKLLNDGVLAFMQESQMKKNKLLVHCQMGQNRSPTILLAFLMTHKNLTLFRAWREVKPKRVIAQPHWKYIQQLRDWDVYLHGKHSTPKDFLKVNVSHGNIEVEYEHARTARMESVLQISRSEQRKSSAVFLRSEDSCEDGVLSPSKVDNESLEILDISYDESQLYEDQHESKYDLYQSLKLNHQHE